MFYAIIGDIHGNLEALNAVLDDIRSFRVDRIINLGDTVGYGANPNECINLVRWLDIITVAGNHDQVAAHKQTAEGFNYIAHQAIGWCMRQLTLEHKIYLHELPLALPFDSSSMAFHGSPRDVNAYLIGAQRIKGAFDFMARKFSRINLGFFGHTHQRGLWAADQQGMIHQLEPQESKIFLFREWRFLVNPGSVGQPRDGSPQASYVLYNSRERSLTFRQLSYDVTIAQEKILAAGLPPYLAERLALGL